MGANIQNMNVGSKTLRPRWYCYVCGEPVGNSFRLFSMNDSTDRVFLVHEERCSDRVEEDENFVVRVRRADRAPALENKEGK